MKNRIIKEIARLASSEFQRSAILNGTKDNYVIPEELIDAVRATIHTVIESPALADSLSQTQIESLQHFEREAELACKSIPWTTMTSVSDLLGSAQWSRLRHAANECLRDFDVDVREWEASNRG